jgi:hypothetical protein
VNSGSPNRPIAVNLPATAPSDEAVAASVFTTGTPNDATIDFLVDVANRKIESQHEVIGELDQKCSVLLGFSLVSVIEMLGFLLLVAVEQPTNGTREPSWVHFVFHLAMILVVIGSAILLLSLKGVAYHAISAAEFCALCDVTKDYREIASAVLANSGRAMTRNFLVIRQRRRKIRVAAVVIGVGLVLFAVLAARMFEMHF